jgi:hypothetical protein
LCIGLSLWIGLSWHAAELYCLLQSFLLGWHAWCAVALCSRSSAVPATA